MLVKDTEEQNRPTKDTSVAFRMTGLNWIVALMLITFVGLALGLNPNNVAWFSTSRATPFSTKLSKANSAGEEEETCSRDKRMVECNNLTVSRYFEGRHDLENATDTKGLSAADVYMLAGLQDMEYAVVGETRLYRLSPIRADGLVVDRCCNAIETTCVNYNRPSAGPYATHMTVWPPGGQFFTDGWNSFTQTILDLNLGQFAVILHKCESTNFKRYKELRVKPMFYDGPLKKQQYSKAEVQMKKQYLCCGLNALCFSGDD